jgi:hypothetical protein
MSQIIYPRPTKVYNAKNEVAAIYSPGFGAGWSSMMRDKALAYYIMFDQSFVEAKTRGETAAWVDKNLPVFDERVFNLVPTLGWDNAVIAWLPVGSLFAIIERDGHERIEISHADLYTA